MRQRNLDATCANCPYWCPFTDSHCLGRCNYNPPDGVHIPLSEKDGWCGEHPDFFMGEPMTKEEIVAHLIQCAPQIPDHIKLYMQAHFVQRKTSSDAHEECRKQFPSCQSALTLEGHAYRILSRLAVRALVESGSHPQPMRGDFSRQRPTYIYYDDMEATDENLRD